MRRRLGIRFKLMVLIIGLTTLPVVTVTWLAMKNTEQSVEREIVAANTSRMEWANQYLNELIEQMNILFYTVQINPELMGKLQEIDNPNLDVQYTTQKYIGDTLTSLFYSNSRKIDEFTLYIHDNRKTLSVSYVGQFVSVMDIREGPWSRMLDTPTNIYFKQADKRIYAFHSMNRFEDRELIGGLSAKINRKVWDEVGRILDSEPESSFFLSNDEGELLSGSSNAADSGELLALLGTLDVPESGLHAEKTDRHYLFMQKISNGKLTLVKAIPMTAIASSAQATMKAGIVTGSLFAAVSVPLSILFSLQISKPIVRLARIMRTAEIHRFEWQSVKKTDEIGLLEHGYNSMMKRIKELIEVEYRRKIDVQTAQLRTLQAQINPHFLNNTLHLIGGMALEKDAPEIYRVTRVIGDLLRYSISTGGDLVTLGDELRHTENYLFVQEQRFAGRCRIQVDKEERSLRSRIPKFTLQPLVENAFEHGLQKKVGKWHVRVRIKRIGASVMVAVQDDGVGLDSQQLAAVRRGLRTGQEAYAGLSGEEPRGRRRGIGLHNVDSRLKLHFGDRCGIRMFSKPGAGTLVVFTVPAAAAEVNEATKTTGIPEGEEDADDV